MTGDLHDSPLREGADNLNKPMAEGISPSRLRALLSELMDIAQLTDEDPARVVAEVVAWVNEVLDPADGPFAPGFEIRVRLYASSAIINAAMVTGSITDLELGARWASAAIDEASFAERDRLSAKYNQANALSAIVKVQIDQRHQANPTRGWPVAYRDVRWSSREILATVRAGYHAYATQFPDPEQRSTGWCNLGNEFDLSGRWVEAYDAYVSALTADPTNGNAAGNAARLIQQIANAGWGYGDHLHGLHDQYLAKAHALRDRTVALAGEHAAKLYDVMTPFACDSSTHHPPEADNPYQVWAAQHRLALAPVLEGIGADQSVWDSAMITGVVTPGLTVDVPPIFRMLNLIKAEYLTARKLAYKAEQMLDETPFEQHPDDPGRYINTLDYAVYGEAPAMLFLAQRSALDTLDKIAVAVNEHLGLGDNPKKISFRQFWTTQKGDQIRPELLIHDTVAFLALAELALDLGKDGIYIQAQDLRHTATHRFPIAHLGLQDITSTDALVPISVDQTIEATRHALSIARSAYLYVVAALESIENRTGTQKTVPMQLFDQHKPTTRTERTI